MCEVLQKKTQTLFPCATAISFSFFPCYPFYIANFQIFLFDWTFQIFDPWPFSIIYFQNHGMSCKMIKDLMEWPGRCPQGEILMYIWYWSVVYTQMIDKVVKVGWCDFLCSFILICISLCICLYKRADCNGGKGNCLLPCGIFIVFFWHVYTPGKWLKWCRLYNDYDHYRVLQMLPLGYPWPVLD